MLMNWLWMLLPGVVIMFVNPRLMRWIERSRLRVRPASEARSLVQPRGLLAIGFGFLVAAAVFGFAMFDWLASRVGIQGQCRQVDTSSTMCIQIQRATSLMAQPVSTCRH